MSTALYMKGERPFEAFLSNRPGLAFLCAVFTFLLSSAGIIYMYLARKRLQLRHFHLIVTMNLVTVLLILVTSEIAMRLLSRPSPQGETLGSMVLTPKNWDRVARANRQLLDEAASRLSYLIYDDLMGWTVGPNRKSANELYYSSSEGLRAPHEGVSLANFTGKARIALVGDSFTFGEEVAYEDTWGHLLEKALGSEYQVLNAGVGSYALDQAFLRFEKDVRQWNPKVVVFSFISHDVERTMHVYPFLSFPEWKLPFSKPRLILRDETLKRLNVSPLASDAIFSRKSVFELPFLEYDKGFSPDRWQEHVPHLSYLARTFMTMFPPWQAHSPDVSDEARVSVNASIVKAFVQSATEAGIIPIVVYFPQAKDLQGPSLPPLGKQVLQRAGIAYTDLTPCLLAVSPQKRFAPGTHYSQEGNAAVAKCLVGDVRRALAQASVPHAHGGGAGPSAQVLGKPQS
ncbi:MAG: hypothetical protein KF722_14235 [Nitrospira sp.]|nr:hypothetical protein [Nitrospira sp.]